MYEHTQRVLNVALDAFDAKEDDASQSCNIAIAGLCNLKCNSRQSLPIYFRTVMEEIVLPRACGNADIIRTELKPWCCFKKVPVV